MSPGGENLLDVLKLQQVLSTYDGDLRDPLWWPQESPVPMRVAQGPLGILLPSMPGPKTLCGDCAGTGDFLSSADMDLGIFLESPQGSQSSSRGGHASALSSRAVAAVSRFPSLGSKDVCLSLEAFPLGFPTRLSHRAVPRASVVLVDPRLESRGSAGKTGFPGMDWDIWGTLGMVARPWSSSRLSCGERLLLR